MIEGTLDRMRKCSEHNNLNIDANHVAPTFRSACADLKVSATIKESFWVNIIGRGYPLARLSSLRKCDQRACCSARVTICYCLETRQAGQIGRECSS
jgi:hypothetical protein